MMKSSRVCRAASRINTSQLYSQIEPNPTHNWRASWAEKLKVDEDVKKEVHHKHMVAEYGEGYENPMQNHFPMPLVYATCLIVWYAVMVCYQTYNDPRTNHPAHVWRPKNADGTTQFPVEPINPLPLFEYEVHEKPVNPF
eukprot:TRINITY_DN50762_c0_g1_i1.p2 TRINITY_DN50762_c0_g1~~TRINITY_DN50762_c0_g1_i1.p2  ORF type:complete len:158 (+),score=61.65 TRINITY_DN50762_c0_g1_i1:56-475(+)